MPPHTDADFPLKRMLSAVQPSNPVTLGNLVGTMRQWKEYQESFDSFFFAVDEHAITLRQDPKALREHSYRLIATCLASGLNPKRCTLFIQSHVPEHTQLGWTLLCHSYMGELSRMTQFKDKSANQGENIPAGLLAYPTLMAADILLYRAHRIPVGHDQKQHIELTRDIAQRMNRAYARELFVVPEPFIPPVGARIMSLQDPTKKMSKSDPDPKATVFLIDSDKQIQKKIKSAVTDSGTTVVYSQDKPGVKNLIDIQSALTGRTPEEITDTYAGKLYGHLKMETADVVISCVAPIRDEAQRLLGDLTFLDAVLAEGAAKARQVAGQTLREVHDALGFVLPSSPLG